MVLYFNCSIAFYFSCSMSTASQTFLRNIWEGYYNGSLCNKDCASNMSLLYWTISCHAQLIFTAYIQSQTNKLASPLPSVLLQQSRLKPGTQLTTTLSCFIYIKRINAYLHRAKQGCYHILLTINECNWTACSGKWLLERHSVPPSISFFSRYPCHCSC